MTGRGQGAGTVTHHASRVNFASCWAHGGSVELAESCNLTFHAAPPDGDARGSSRLRPDRSTPSQTLHSELELRHL